MKIHVKQKNTKKWLISSAISLLLIGISFSCSEEEVQPSNPSAQACWPKQ